MRRRRRERGHRDVSLVIVAVGSTVGVNQREDIIRVRDEVAAVIERQRVILIGSDRANIEMAVVLGLYGTAKGDETRRCKED